MRGGKLIPLLSPFAKGGILNNLLGRGLHPAPSHFRTGVQPLSELKTRGIRACPEPHGSGLCLGLIVYQSFFSKSNKKLLTNQRWYCKFKKFVGDLWTLD